MARKYVYIGVAATLIMAVAGALYYAIEIAGWVDEEVIAEYLKKYRHSPWAPVYVVGAYIAAGLTFFPVTVISLAIAAVFGPVWSVVYGIAGMLVSGTIIFFIGQKMRGREARHFIRQHIEKYDKQLKESGAAGITTLRMVIFAPFTIFNLVCGISSVRYIDFAIGTFLGLLPGFIVRAIVGDSILPLLFNPSVETITYMGIGLTLWVALVLLTRKLSSGESSEKTA